MTEDTSLPPTDPEPAPRPGRLRRLLTAHPVVTGVVAAVVVGAGAVAWQFRDLVDPTYTDITFAVPDAPDLTPSAAETLYRIDPSRSEAGYRIGERIAGAEATTAVGRTNGIAGDIALNEDDPAATRVGRIVVNVEQLTSDSTLRDARIRADFLESHTYPLVRFDTTSIDGLPDTITPGRSYDVTIAGDLEVRTTTRPVTWTGTARRSGDELELTASTTVKLTDFGMAPITVIGLVSTDDELTLELDLVAVDAEAGDVPTRVEDRTRVVDTGGGPSFAREVRPILEQSCVGCHTSGEIGADVLLLDTAGDASTYASGIALASRTGYMPPWPASTVGIPLQHPRTLDPAHIDLLQRWADSGGAIDVAASTRLEAAPPEAYEQIRVDEVLEMPEPYVGDGTITNDYRCVVLDPQLDEPTYVTGYSFEPGTREVVHHALAYRMDAADRDAILAKSGSDGRPGWQCNVGTGVSVMSVGEVARGGPRREALIAGWVPGQRPIPFGEGVGFLLNPGELIVVQMHYHYGDKVLSDQSRLLLQTAPATPDMRELVVSNPVAPVELPCPAVAADGPLCDRGAAMADLVNTYGPEATVVPDALGDMCGPTAATSDPVTGNGSSTCDRRIGRDGEIVDVLGHMHTLGASFRMTLNPGTPGEQVLLDIPVWNFDWQLNYQPVQPVPVKRGDTIRIECSWDRSLRHDPEPRYIVFAEGTEDEMCFSTYTLLPAKR